MPDRSEASQAPVWQGFRPKRPQAYSVQYVEDAEGV